MGQLKMSECIVITHYNLDSFNRSIEQLCLKGFKPLAPATLVHNNTSKLWYITMVKAA